MKRGRIIQNRKIVAADLFCGAGGTSSGLVLACKELGLDLDLTAINHWSVSIATHTANHAAATHFCEDLAAIDPLKAVPGGRLDLLLASPECTHHSNARGGKPMQDQSRASAWHITRWAGALQIDNILIENVIEFENWGPLKRQGRPIQSRRGETFRAFLHVLRSMNYRVDHRTLVAADYGEATTRRRLFVMARRGSRKLRWPSPTHARKPADDLFGLLPRWRAAREIIDWTIQGQSIFSRKRPLCENTMRRIMAGLVKFGGPELEPFIVMMNGTAPWQTARSSRSVDSPLSTVTAANHHYLAEPMLLGQQSGAAARPVSQPAPTIAGAGAIGLIETSFVLAPEGVHRGNAPRATSDPLPTITAQRGGGHLVQPRRVRAVGPKCDSHSTEDPLNTVLTREHRGLVEAFVVRTDHTGAEGPGVRSVNDPIPTATGKNGLGICEPFLVPQVSGAEPKSTEKPVSEITTTTRGMGLTEGFIVEYHGSHAGRADGEQRVKSVDEPLPTQTCDPRFAVAQAFLVPNFGERDGQEPRTHSVDDPLPAVTSHGAGAIAQPFVVHVTNGGGADRTSDITNPLPTVTCAARGEMALIDAHISKFNGTGGPTSVNEPLDTVTSRDRFALVQPMIVQEDGTTLALDIRFRMLQPHELAGAMGFDRGYVFTGSREAQVKQIGNAVPVNLAKALIQSLLADL